METTYFIRTEACTRSKTRRTMHQAIIAASREDAEYEARKAHVARVGWNTTVWIAAVQTAPFTSEQMAALS